ncbi:MAG: ribulose-phosphate 3-epimerase [Candidatus Cloacimonetes bacterium 4572_55]|nr:MAG: ribulose-phosphate 3-epimerase [Candidatus Cloacimonetes bacterium 4572_55]
MRLHIAPSILSADFRRLEEEITAVEQAGADWIHLDVMDGTFVPNITFGPMVVDAVNRCTSLPLDVHLMIESPERYIEDFVRAGADYLTIHVETGYHHQRTLSRIRLLGAKAGVSLNPGTPLQSIEYLLPDLDLLLIMTVNPGFGGQSFLERLIPKIKKARQIIDTSPYSVLLEVDGGVNSKIAPLLRSEGVDVLVSGSAIFSKDDYQEAIAALKESHPI